MHQSCDHPIIELRLVVEKMMTMVVMTMTMVTTMVVMMRMVLMVATFPIEVNSVVRERSGGD